GYVSGTLALRPGLRAPVPPLDPRPLLTMADMAMEHAAGGRDVHEARGAQHAIDAHETHASHAGEEAQAIAAHRQSHPASEQGEPLVDGQAAAPRPRLDDPGAGLRDNGRQVLSYAMLHSTFADPDGREPGRDVELHLTGHMEKFAWSFNGIKFSSSEPLRLNYGERLRIVLVNDTMMTHPIHLHGMWSDVEDEQGRFMVRKHTVDMPPGARRSYRVRADALGNWAYHCHLLFHMEAGMMRTVQVVE